MITSKVLIILIGFVIFLDLVSLTILLVININALRNINKYLINVQEEKEILNAMKEALQDEEIEIL